MTEAAQEERAQEERTESVFLRRPVTEEDWAAYHDIRRRAIFEDHLPDVEYDPQHPDEIKPGNFPLVLVQGMTVVGAVRVDLLDEERAALRLVAIDPARQRQGLGRHLLDLCETLIRAHRRKRIVLHANPASVEFYRSKGFRETPWPEDQSLAGAHVDMAKDL